MRMGFLGSWRWHPSARAPRACWPLALAAGLAILSLPIGGDPAATAGDPSPAADESHRHFTDALGHEISWLRPPQRIVSLSPSVTEILFAIGHDAGTIVGRTRFCTAPTRAAAVPVVGGIVDPSLEMVLQQQPDLVLATRGNPLEFMESLKHLDMPVYAIETRGGLSQILAAIREIGDVTGRAEAAERVAADSRRRIHEVERRTQPLDASERPRVYYGELEGTHWTAGPGSFIDDLITVAGGRNVGAVTPSAWGALSLEVIVAQDPQVYLGTYGREGRVTARERAIAILTREPAWRGTQLGKAPRLWFSDEDRLQRPSPRVIDALEEFARYLHPALWPDTLCTGGSE